MTDLGTLGLTGSGFEVAAPDVAGLGGFVGTTADASAVSTGRAVAQLEPETSLQYEAGVGYRHRVWRTDLTFFVNNVHANIQKQALILPQGAVGHGAWRPDHHVAERQRRGVRAGVNRPGAGARELRRRADLGHRAHGAGDVRPNVLAQHGLHLPARQGHHDGPAAEHRRRHAGAGRLHHAALDVVRTAAGGSSRTCTSRGSRRTCRRSTSATAAPAPAAAAATSPRSSPTARALAAGLARAPTTSPARPTTC